MRMRCGAVAGMALVGLCGAASAQQQASSFMSGVPASQIKNVPIDTSKVIMQQPGQSALSNRFDFSALFNKRIVPQFPSKRGMSPLPSPSSFPTYAPFKMVGEPPYFIKWMFGDTDTNAFQPMKPFTPTTSSPVGPGS